MRLALLQFSPLVGDPAGNARAILELLDKHAKDADLFVTPELAILGYPPRDLLSQTRLLDAERAALGEVRAWTACSGKAVLVGHSEKRFGRGRGLFNAASLYSGGEILGTVRKRRLPNYDIFDEERFFEPASAEDGGGVLELHGLKIGVSICEDDWDGILAFGRRDVRVYPEGSARNYAHADLLINVSASPWSLGKGDYRESLFLSRAQRLGKAIAYANACGGQDGILYDGRSFFADARGGLLARGAAFAPDVVVAEWTPSGWKSTVPAPHAELGSWEALHRGLVMGLREFVRKSGASKALLGVSGGIDSALVATLAAEALGPDNVLGVALPSSLTDPLSTRDAEDLAKRLGIGFRVVPVAGMVESFQKELKLAEGSLGHQNLQSRCRGVALMALSNSENRFLLATGNKSELALGYCTLYGDMNGALAPIGDLYKTEVYGLCHHLNALARETGRPEPIPSSTLVRPPTAELAPGQKDVDSLPDYEILDGLLEGLIENQGETLHGNEDDWNRLLAGRFTVESIRRKLHSQEFKRYQAPPILRVHGRAFGAGWHFPLVKGLP
jgi:NAD+ synthetase